MMIQRPFSSGSRQAPDPHDNFLEQAGFYRKHTARDSSCLFRVISEQMYDTQNHHAAVRETCVSYMRNNKLYFQKSLKQYVFDVDIDEYLDELSKSKTFGTLLELEAVAHMFARNVVLFRPLELGRWFFYNPNFDKTFQVFVSHDRHFDTVYAYNFIEDAAFCQSIVYELLYKHVFKLPDITYAVERMLHATSFEEIDSTSEGLYCRKIFLKDGRTFELDMPENTDCILNNYELCHFHNPNFPGLAQMLQNEVNKFDPSYASETKIISPPEYWSPYETQPPCFYPNNHENVISDNDLFDGNSHLKQLDSLLPEKYVSCVRQLLYEGITPFPYKVAKALDPDMYRNIEFDSWSEMRKEQRWKNWYTGGNSLQVGVKCQVYLRKQDEFYTGYIQEMPETKNEPCIVFIEDLGEKRSVPYDCLKPLPPDQVKPWPLPYRWQKQYEKFQQQQSQMYSPAKFFKRFTSHTSKCKIAEFDYNVMNSCQLENSICEKENVNLKLKQYCSLDNFTSTIISKPIEIIAMPLNVESERTPLNNNAQRNQNNNSELKSLDSAINNKVDETASRSPSAQHTSQQDRGEVIEPTCLVENNMILESNSAMATVVGNDASCPYPLYNYYTEPYYAYHPFDNSIIHATSGGHSYYCVVPNPTSNVIPHTAPPNNVFMSPGSAVSCGSTGGVNNHITSLGYYSSSGAFFPASAIPQPIINPSASNGRQVLNNNSNNVNFAVQKSVMECGADLPKDVATLRFFFNLGWDYYNEINDEKNKDSGNRASDLAIDFQKIKIENDSSNQEKADSNNNIVTSNNSLNETTSNDQYSSYQNSSQNITNNKNSHPKYNTNNRETKHFTSRCFNNRKPNSYNRGNGNSNAHRFSQTSQSSRNINNNNTHNSKNDNRNLNANCASKMNIQKNDCYQKVNNNSYNCNYELESSNVTEIQSGNKTKETFEVASHPSPVSISENMDTVQTVTQRGFLSASAPATPYTMPYNQDNSTYANEQISTIPVNGTSPNGNIFVPQVIAPVPFGMCQTVPPPSAVTQSYNTMPQNSSVLHNPSYYLSPGQSGPINTSHPPPPLPTTTVPPPPPPPPPTGGVPLLQAAAYPMQASHLQQSYYYPFPTQTAGSVNTAASETSTSSMGGGGGDFNLMNYTPEPNGSYPLMNFPVYYTPTNNSALTPTTNNGSGHMQSGGPVSGNAYQGYWLTTATIPPQVTVTTPTSNKINYSANSNVSH
ncbi:protein ovarian tumor locus-like [Condylostylus longicornis]|uniref:protein ovarian tumor locus-like n=1 Tax=Condylostylus longicornis TaxID=2530218 RepID=UPI00244DEC67|nr:protein ovarian tumor locus-like [Condylostylus longicornis]